MNDDYRIDAPHGRDLKQARKAAGLTQYELADRVGVAQSTIAAWEGAYADPEREHSKRLRDVLDGLDV